MPTYEYRCPNGHAYEKFYRKMSDAIADLPCPQCGAPGVRQVSGGAGLLFKGSGFYITDYGKDGKKDQRRNAPASDGSGAASGSSATGGQESGSGTGAAKPSTDTPASKPSTPPKSGE